ncbi:MAG: hypothetical protein H5T44_05225 [Thermoplasmatales archaeon]|nr:hypothetical protein [Thermoplasmatales archaeon]
MVAVITYKNNYSSCLQPVVVITQPQDGAILNDSHLIVVGYASYEFGLNYWEEVIKAILLIFQQHHM